MKNPYLNPDGSINIIDRFESKLSNIKRGNNGKQGGNVNIIRVL